MLKYRRDDPLIELAFKKLPSQSFKGIEVSKAFKVRNMPAGQNIHRIPQFGT